MDYKEKYKAALERAKEELGSGCFNKGSIEYIFPELKESEDERIRKHLISLVKNWDKDGIVSKYTSNANDIKQILAWLEKVKDFDKQLEEAYKNSDEVQYKRGYDDGYLEGIANAKKELEKQGEMDIEMDIEKPITIGKRRVVSGKLKELIDNKDPKSIEETKKKMLEETKTQKFKVGDWIITKDKNVHKDYSVCKIVEIENNRYHLENGDYLDIDTLEQYDYRLWTIQDAKDGDVLYSPCCKLSWIYKDEKTCYVGYNPNYNSGSIVINKPVCIPTDVIPATKEQRDLLFQKMKQAGYYWDGIDRELKKEDKE